MSILMFSPVANFGQQFLYTIWTSLGNGNGLNGLNGNGNYGGSNMYLHNNGNGGATVESSNMLISTMATPPSGNAKRPAAGRGYNKSLCRNLQQLHFWLPLWGVQQTGNYAFWPSKFIYFEKATKFCKIFALHLPYVVTSYSAYVATSTKSDGVTNDGFFYPNFM